MDEMTVEEVEGEAPSPVFLKSPEKVMEALGRDNSMDLDIEVVPNSHSGEDTDDSDDDNGIELVSKRGPAFENQEPDKGAMSDVESDNEESELEDSEDDKIKVFFDKHFGIFFLVSREIHLRDGSRSFILAHNSKEIEVDEENYVTVKEEEEIQALKAQGKFVDAAPEGYKFLCSDGIGVVQQYFDKGAFGEGATIVGDVNGNIFEGKLATPEAYMAMDLEKIQEDYVSCLLNCSKELKHKLITFTLGADGSKGLFFHKKGEGEVKFISWKDNADFSRPHWLTYKKRQLHLAYGQNKTKYWENIEDVDVEDGVENIYEF